MEDGAAASGPFQAALMLIGKFIEYLSDSSVVEEAMKGAIGPNVDINLHYLRTGQDGAKIGTIEIKNNSTETITIGKIIVKPADNPGAKGIQFNTDQLIVIHPGDKIPIEINQGTGLPYEDPVNVTIQAIGYDKECNTKGLVDLVTISIPIP